MATSDEILVGDLFDYMADRPQGITNVEYMHHADIDLGTFNRLIRRLRTDLGDDTITVAARPEGAGPWTYWLTSTYYDGVDFWTKSRFRDLASRLHTGISTGQTVYGTLDKRTTEARELRVKLQALKSAHDMVVAASDEFETV